MDKGKQSPEIRHTQMEKMSSNREEVMRVNGDCLSFYSKRGGHSVKSCEDVPRISRSMGP